jgi:periplasmic protein TonB
MKTIFMEARNIMSADILDILFDNRNKEYGAYDLRKHYKDRLTKSLLSMLLIVGLLVFTYLWLSRSKPGDDQKFVPEVLTLAPVEKKPDEPEKIKPPPVKLDPPKFKTVVLTPPKIMEDEKVKEEDRPPEQKEMETAKIGTVKSDGAEDPGLAGPTELTNKGIVEAPKKQAGDDLPFTKVEIESQYPGGPGAWAAYLNRNLSYPDQAAQDEIQGTVMIQFIVDVEGNVSNVVATAGPEALRNAAITVIKKSGRWTAAVQNGKKVKSYKNQPITFKLGTEN